MGLPFTSVGRLGSKVDIERMPDVPMADERGRPLTIFAIAKFDATFPAAVPTNLTFLARCAGNLRDLEHDLQK
jgi:hypothetical protein